MESVNKKEFSCDSIPSLRAPFQVMQVDWDQLETLLKKEKKTFTHKGTLPHTPRHPWVIFNINYIIANQGSKRDEEVGSWKDLQVQKSKNRSELTN